MKRKRYSAEQIVYALREAEAGAVVTLARRQAIKAKLAQSASAQTVYITWKPKCPILAEDVQTGYDFLKCMEKAELRRRRFHDLRHTYASLLLTDGAPVA
tara:strand:+ start:31 stop:330 length:300 start_codon:yes stop_codon:yes gene_type:complete